ncbi:MAG TPA: ABC transporter substrate-binding protein, partial [Acidimicrobiales bacterium]|nr:ABC transporter substrate-binding protein [Acidimicrobiales bacterium]
MDNFNPFTWGGNLSLVIYNSLLNYQYFTGTATSAKPWLATGYSWSANDEELTLTLRHGVEFSDGTPFTSADVVSTFTLLKKYPDINPNGITFATIAAPNAYTVRFTFDAPSYSEFFYIAMTPIVPTSWDSIGDPGKYADTSPVGTGPLMLKTFTPEDVTLVPNPKFWGPQPKTCEVQWLDYTTATTAALAIEAHQLDWSNLFWAGWKTDFVDRSPENQVDPIPVGVQPLIPNLGEYPLNLLPLRQALSLVIDRKELAAVGEYGYDTPAVYETDLFPGDLAEQEPSLSADTF